MDIIKRINKTRLAMLLLGVFLMMTAVFNIFDNEAVAEPKMEVYYVKTGDTLWDIAAKRIDNSVDIREKMYEIEHDNKLKGDLKVGQKLRLRAPQK